MSWPASAESSVRRQQHGDAAGDGAELLCQLPSDADDRRGFSLRRRRRTGARLTADGGRERREGGAETCRIYSRIKADDGPGGGAGRRGCLESGGLEVGKMEAVVMRACWMSWWDIGQLGITVCVGGGGSADGSGGGRSGGGDAA